MARAWASPRCGACTRQGSACRSPAMPNGRCRMHGGGSRGPTTAEGLARSRTSTRTHGRRSAEHAAMRRQMRAAFTHLREMVRATNAELRETEALHRAMMRRLGR
ncbi:hypothetical protein MMSR116_17730 [Methylobacterium mesophilicum SR1.6/6]|uniref:Uncharacterized protein n=1 Tax=Methylobacterium mesophilicum SR1.6/6 TaxID=908290 RepID=A0A6B9FND7_9HYPH|nr:hypothetical protein MMSR116_17730 [Methylobacterium mesophilicum SR1.6/6]